MTYPNLHADFSGGSVCLSKAVVDIRFQSVKRNTALFVLLLTGKLRAAQTSGAVDLDAVGAHVHRGLDGAFHGAAEADALLEKFSHVTKWNEPKKVGRRIYDDKVFYESLSKQRSEGKALSDRQFAALQKLAAKYQL